MSLRLATLASLLAATLIGCGKEAPKTAAKPSGPLSDDLSWVQEMAPGGALAYSADREIYVLEIAGGKPKKIGGGFMPEFSPDGSKLAWVDNDRLSVANRDGSGLRRLHDRMFKHGGAHWLDNEHIAAILSGPGGYRWYRFGLDGRREAMPELDQFGISKEKGRETDVRQAADGVWTHVAYRTWKTSDGKSAPIDGGCACSISPDAKSITALQGTHTELKIRPVREGGLSHDLKWLYKGRFDNHRWASNDERFLVGVREKPTRMVLIDWRTGRAASFGRTDHKDKTRMYGDLTKADGKAGKAMPALLSADQRESPAAVTPVDRGKPVELDAWPYRTEGMVYLYDTRSAPNEFREFAKDPPTSSSGQLRDHATYDRFGRLDLSGGSYQVTSATELAGDFAIEFIASNGAEAGAIAKLGTFTVDAKSLPLLTGETGHHLIISSKAGVVTAHVNGLEPVELRADPAPTELKPVVFGDGWDGTLEAIAIFNRPIGIAEATKRYALASPRLAERDPAPRSVVEAKLVQYTPPIPLAEMDNYRRLVCEHVFEIESVTEGDLKPGQQIRVLAWSILDLKPLPEKWKGKEGQTFRLTLESEEFHTDLGSKERLEGDGDLDKDGYFLVDRP